MQTRNRTKAPMMISLAPSERWSLHFISDQPINGRHFRILTIIDDCTSECLALVGDTSLLCLRVVRELDRLIIERGRKRQWHQLTSNTIPALGR
jgi:putative transposase